MELKLKNSELKVIIDDDLYTVVKDKTLSLSNGYARLGTGEWLHRFIGDCAGISVNGLICDHINGNRLDNRVINLRWVTYRENTWNRIKTSKSQYNGVTWVERDRCWRARFKIKGSTIHLGEFKGDEDGERQAALKYNEAVEKYMDISKLKVNGLNKVN